MVLADWIQTSQLGQMILLGLALGLAHYLDQLSQTVVFEGPLMMMMLAFATQASVEVFLAMTS